MVEDEYKESRNNIQMLKLAEFASCKTANHLLVSRIGCSDESPWRQKKGILEIEEQNFEDESQPQSIKCGSRILLSGSTLSLKMLYGSSTMIFSRSFWHLILEFNDCLKGVFDTGFYGNKE